MNQNRRISNFTKQYPIIKTFRWKLIPKGETEKYMALKQYEDAARRKDEKYPIVKALIDEKIKTFIQDVLEHCEKCDWSALEAAVLEYQKTQDKKDDKQLKDVQKKMRQRLSKEFENHKDYKIIFGENLLKTLQKEVKEKEEMEKGEKAAVEEFQKFKTYFENFFTVREAIFSSEEKQNTIPYRIVNENFMIFVGNKKVFSKIMESIPDMLQEATTAGRKKPEWESYEIENITRWFETENFQMCMSGSGISRYNFVVGILNQAVNLYVQQHAKEQELKRGKLKLRVLHKQILSDKIRPAWLPEQFAEGEEGEQQIEEAIRSFEKSLQEKQFVRRYQQLLENVDVTSREIYIAGDAITKVSCILQLGWNGLTDRIKEVLEARLLESGKKENVGTQRKNAKKAEKGITKKQEEEIERILKKDISLADLSMAWKEYANRNPEEELVPLEDCFAYGRELTFTCEDDRNKFHAASEKKEKPLNQEEERIEALKQYLDSYQEILHFLKLFAAGDELDKDAEFYGEWDALLEDLSEITPLYDKIRNYVTRKPYSVDKIRIMFENSDFLSGWGQTFDTKEAIIFQKGSLYYVGVVERRYKEQEMNYLYEGIKESNQAVRFVYNFQPVDNKNIPRIFVRSKGENYAPAVKKYQLPIEDIIEIYDTKKFAVEYKKVNEKEYYESLEKLIDYFKEGISKHESYQPFDFQWKPSNEYENINEFYKDTANACFLLKKEAINFDHLIEQVSQGKIYLFQIASKDFKEGSTGTPNLQTMYWKELFSDRNAQERAVKLCGGASIYMRDASIENPVQHEKGTTLINRWYLENGEHKVIENETYRKFLKITQGRLSEKELTPEELALWESGRVQMKKATHTIVKDRRFTEKQYMLHTPVMINYQQEEKTKGFNDKVCRYLKDNPDVNIIGIDRGEKNLIYITIIDRKGNIIPNTQKSLNQVEQKSNQESRIVDYHQKLEAVEQNHDLARKNWKQIGTIKELKEGYLSQVVHEITQLMVQYNAIIVMENLNMPFKKGRIKVEKSVYQKFEKMLIDKLNYLAFKRDMEGNPVDAYAPGGVMNGYQLSDKFTSFSEMGTQNGFIFYVPAAYTSAIDPVTGFVDVFKRKEWSTLQGKLSCLKRFEDISWDKALQSFTFTFDYGCFQCSTTSYRKKWKLTADVKRIKTTKLNNQHCEKHPCNPNQELRKLFDEREIPYLDGHNLVEDLDTFDADTIWKIVENFKLILQLRNSWKNQETGKLEDYIASPALYHGKTFISDEKNNTLPQDADANGAYHIALKGLLCLNKIDEFASEDGKIQYKNLKITNEEWFRFMQTRNEDADV